MLIAILLSIVPSHLALAASNQLLINSESTYQMPTNTTFTVRVKAFFGTSTTTQTAIGNIKYPTGQLQFISSQPNGSGFNSPSVTPKSGGIIEFSASRTAANGGTLGTGVVQLFDVTFRTVGAGTAIVEFTGDSRVNGADTTYKSAVFSITNPNPSPSPTQSVAPKPTPSSVPAEPKPPTPVITPTPSPDTQEAPTTIIDPQGIVTGVEIDPDYNKGRITWRVEAPNPTSSVMYGTKSSDISQKAEVTKESDGTFSTTLTGLDPGVRYYFTITGSGDGDKNGTYSSTMTTNGYPVRITVTENEIPAKNAQIRINNLNKITDADGKVTISLPQGEFKGTVTTDTASLDITIKVEKKTIPGDGSAPPAQAISFNLTSSPLEQGPGSGQAILTFVGVLVAGTALLAMGAFGFITYRRRKFETSTSNGMTTTVIIEDGYDWRSQTEPSQPPTVPTTTISNNNFIQHKNSVYIDEEEPVDMFDKK